MKILYLAFIRLPTEKAHGLQIMKTCSALATLGAHIELVIPKRRSPIQEDPYTYYGVQNNFTITGLNTPDFVGLGKIGFIFSLIWFSEQAKLLKQFWSSDFLYSRDSLVLVQYFFLGRPILFEAHRYPTFVDTIAARIATHVFVITESLRKEFLKKGIASNKLTVIHDAADRAAHDALPYEKREGVVYAGSFSAHKGILTMLEAARLLSTRSDVRFTLYGDTKHFEHSVPTNVTLAGLVKPSEVYEKLSSAKIVLVPNSARTPQSSTYTSPMKLFEALHSGAVVIASDTPAIREVVSKDEVVFFTPDDAQSLAEKIEDVNRNPEYQKMIPRALSLAASFGWEARARAILEALKK
jgi:glycosyltransferase involved in cell wall biosynthesis